MTTKPLSRVASPRRRRPERATASAVEVIRALRRELSGKELRARNAARLAYVDPDYFAYALGQAHALADLVIWLDRTYHPRMKGK